MEPIPYSRYFLGDRNEVRVTHGSENHNLTGVSDFDAEVAVRKIGLLERLVAGVLHEINSPLAVLSTNAQLLEHAVSQLRDVLSGGVSTPLRADAANLLGILESIRESQKAACDRITETTHSLETCVSGDEADRKPCNVGELLNSVVQLLRNSSGRSHEIVMEYDESHLVEGHARQLTQLFMSLLLNAMEAVGDDGRTTITVVDEPDDVVIGFRDSGLGRISRDEIDSTRSAQSAGLGLALCRHLVEEHGGRLNIESTPGKGTTVRVHLPKRTELLVPNARD